jgi:hypothetical protein
VQAAVRGELIQQMGGPHQFRHVTTLTRRPQHTHRPLMMGTGFTRDTEQ